jgi:acylphosphatase
MTRRYVIHGLVQGVGFRYFAARIAEAFDIAGTVRNTHDGTVEIVASGAPENIRSFKEQISIGPSHGRVDLIDEEEIPDQRFHGFRVLH